MQPKHISILLPTYNCFCSRLVTMLQSQCRALATMRADFDYEIIVADDCSTDRSFVAANSVIETLEGVRYVQLDHNMGRSAIRNFLAHEARLEWLLYIDGDLQVERHDFVENYAFADVGPTLPPRAVVVGGIAIGGDAQQWKENLRWTYEKRCEAAHSVASRQRLAGQEFRTTNFLVPREAVLQHPFDENFRRYGYEDVLFGKVLTDNGYVITHIDNPILLDDFESNGVFVDKTEEACRTLFEFRRQLHGYSRLLSTVERLQRLRLLSVTEVMWHVAGKTSRRRLCNKHPSVTLYNAYKLLYMVHLFKSCETTNHKQ